MVTSIHLLQSSTGVTSQTVEIHGVATGLTSELVSALDPRLGDDRRHGEDVEAGRVQ